MKMTDQNAVEIFKKGGAVAASDWMRGSGNFRAARPTPAKCVKIEVKRLAPNSSCPSLDRYVDAFNSDMGGICSESRGAVYKLLCERPKVRKVIVVKDWQAVRELAEVCVS
jgi:hypothetical protein